jgi:hypothetical protein
MPDDYQYWPTAVYRYAVYYGPKSIRFYAEPEARDAAWQEVKALVKETPHPPGQGEPCCGDFGTFLGEEAAAEGAPEEAELA